MRKKLFLLFILFVFIGLPFFSYAGVFHFGEEYSLQKGDRVEDDLYAAGKNTTIAGDVTGDLLAAGYDVLLGANLIGEDALAIGANVNILSDVKEDLRTAGLKTIFTGKVGGDFVTASKEIQTLPSSLVSGNFLAFAGRAVLNGEIKGNVHIAGGEVFLNDKIGGNVTITAERIVLGPGAVISGEFNYASGRHAEISEGAQIFGKMTYKAIDTRPPLEKFLPTLWGTWLLIQFAVLLIGALIVHGLFKKISIKFVSTSIHQFAPSLLKGFLFAIAVPIAIALVFITLVGIPFGILGIAFYTIFLILASIYGPIILGSIVYRLTNTETDVFVSWKTILVGVVLSILLGYAPYIGFLIKYGLILVALGSIYQVLFDKFVEVR